MNMVFKLRYHYKKGKETEKTLLPTRLGSLVTTVTDSEYNLPLFQKRA